jgi:FkbM family methyltransferase
MSPLRKIYPLWLREKLYFHPIFPRKVWPEGMEAAPLEFAPVKISSLLKTDLGHRQIAWCGFYELDLSRRISSLAKQGGLLVDVGANVGYFSCMWAALNPQNEVYAFEPSPRNLVMLKKNISILPNPDAVKIFDHAVGREDGFFNFDIGPEEQSGWGGLATSQSARTIQIKVKRLDAIIPAGKTVSVLKIDTEGADTWVLMGAENLLRQKRIKNIFFEANLERMKLLEIPSDQVAKFLNGLDYKVSPLGDSEFFATPK